jgi:hypothetical protein
VHAPIVIRLDTCQEFRPASTTPRARLPRWGTSSTIRGSSDTALPYGIGIVTATSGEFGRHSIVPLWLETSPRNAAAETLCASRTLPGISAIKRPPGRRNRTAWRTWAIASQWHNDPVQAAGRLRRYRQKIPNGMTHTIPAQIIGRYLGVQFYGKNLSAKR